MKYLMRFGLYTSLFFVIVFASPAFCSVTLVGTRIIYAASAKEKSLQFNSQDEYPSLVQIWLDKDNPQSKPETADAPFVATPQIFRMNPQSGQLVRLIFTGADLPADRESLFYLNFMQMPALKSSQVSSNLLMLAVTSRVKVFYRPKGLKGGSDKLAEELKFRFQSSGASAALEVQNGTAFHAVIREAILMIGEQKIPLVSGVMLLPKSVTQWLIPLPAQVGQLNRRLLLTLVNDLGDDVISEIVLH